MPGSANCTYLHRDQIHCCNDQEMKSAHEKCPQFFIANSTMENTEYKLCSHTYIYAYIKRKMVHFSLQFYTYNNPRVEMVGLLQSAPWTNNMLVLFSVQFKCILITGTNCSVCMVLLLATITILHSSFFFLARKYTVWKNRRFVREIPALFLLTQIL